MILDNVPALRLNTLSKFTFADSKQFNSLVADILVLQLADLDPATSHYRQEPALYYYKIPNRTRLEQN